SLRFAVSQLPAETLAKVDRARELRQRIGQQLPPHPPGSSSAILLLCCLLAGSAQQPPEPEAQSARVPRVRRWWDNLPRNQPPTHPVPPTVPRLRTVSVPVWRHSSVSLTESEADRILNDMGTVLQAVDGSGD